MSQCNPATCTHPCYPVGHCCPNLVEELIKQANHNIYVSVTTVQIKHK